jgi:hypothetical protein
MSVTNKTPTNASVTTGTVFTPSGDQPADFGYTNPPVPIFSQILGDFTLTTYEFPEDGSSGIALYNGKSAWHIDNLGNMIFTTSQAPQSGCGGKMVSSSEAKIEKSGSIAIEVTGRPNDGEIGKEKNSIGGVDEKKLPAYSLKVYGDVLIECIGGEAVIKGDNITLNASSTLNLNSGKDINISAGGQGGRINMTGGTFALNTGFFEKNLSGGEYSKGAGEVQIEQYNPNASTSVNTPGSVKYTVNGDYEVGVTGEYKQVVNKNYTLSVDLDYAHAVKGNYSEKIEGKQKSVVDGKTVNATAQKENYLMEIGAAVKGTPAFKVSSGSDVEMETTTGGITFQTAKQVSKMTLTEKEFKVNVGKQLGAIELTQTQALLSYGKTSKITLEAAKISAVATQIYLN